MTGEVAVWYYVNRDRQQAGPVTEANLLALYRYGDVDDGTLVWCQGMPDWAPYSAVLNQSVMLPAVDGESTVDASNATRFGADNARILPKTHPWRRYIAKVVDIATSGLATFFVVVFVIAMISHPLASRVVHLAQVPLVSGLLLTLVWIPIEVMCLSVFGTTPARWVFGIRVRRVDGGLPSANQAFRRTLWLVAQGMGLSLPILGLICPALSYRLLTEEGHTPWDEGQGLVVTHAVWGPGRAFVATAVTILVCVMQGMLSWWGKHH